MATSKRKPIKTELQLRNLKPEDKTFDQKVAYASGLVVRVDKAGGKSFRWDRGRGQKPRIVTHGQYPALSLKKAIALHTKAQEQQQDGVMPAADADVPQTVEQLAEIFYTDRIVPNRKRPDSVRQVLDHDVLPQIGKMRLRSVTTMVVRRVVKDVVNRGATAHAGKVLGVMKQMLRFGVTLEAVEYNTAEPLERVDLGIEDSQRDRVLSSDEIRLFWMALEQAPRMSIQVRIALQLLVLLGLRSGELRQAQWSHVDLVARTLTIPVANQKVSPRQAKKARPFVVPLDGFAISLLEKLAGMSKTWLFPGATGEACITDKVLGRATRRLLQLEVDGERLLPVEPFSPHDLRRTMRSNLSKLGVAPHVAEACLNHSLGRIVAIYDRHDYSDERREALELWSNQVQVILGKHDNVVLMEAV